MLGGVWEPLIAIAIIWMIVIWIKWRMPYRRGKLGERVLNPSISKLDPAKYPVLNYLLLPCDDCFGTAQIDHVVVSSFGIFFIETKNYSGWSFGDARQRNWTQVVYRFRQKFYNPLWQNYGHVK